MSVSLSIYLILNLSSLIATVSVDRNITNSQNFTWATYFIPRQGRAFLSRYS